MPDPPSPPTVPSGKREKSDDTLPLQEIIPVSEPHAPPSPVEPIPVTDSTPQGEVLHFSFYNTPCSVHLDESHRFTLPSCDEKSASAAWSQLSHPRYNQLINECLQLRDQLQLCDWGYYELLRILSTEFAGNTDEATLLQMYLLTQSGYKARIARAGSRLCLLLPSDRTIFSRIYIEIDTEKYYLFDSSLSDSESFFVFNRQYPNEQPLSILMNKVPAIAKEYTPLKSYSARGYSQVSVQAGINRNLMDFYNTYPRNDHWSLYSIASLSPSLKDSLYPALTRAIAEKPEEETADILLNFVQTAFDYKTDEEQFGCERPLFGDEIFYYSYSDCEYRAILYSILVRELMGLEVVFLYYPDLHLSTAVRFHREDIGGDHVTVDGKKYLVCDPTYIGASIGCAMPDLKKTPVNVIKINGQL